MINILPAVLLFAQLAPAITDTLIRRDALDRPGIYHASVRGRIVGEDGEPIPAVRVLALSRIVRDQPWQFPVFEVPLASHLTGEDGAFDFHDLSAIDWTCLRIEPPPDFFGRPIVLDLVSNQAIDVGDIRLQRNTTIWGTVEITNEHRNALDIHPTVRLAAMDESGQIDESQTRVARSAWSDGIFILDEITSRVAYLELSFMRDFKHEHYRTPITIENGRRDVFLTLRPLPETLEQTERGLYGKLDVVQAKRALPAAEPRTVRGVVLAPDRSPLARCFVQLTPVHAGSWAHTNGAGYFELDARGTRSSELHVSWLGSELRFPSSPDTGPSAPLEIVVDARPLRLRAEGASDARVSYAWYFHGLWAPLSGSETWFPIAIAARGDAIIRADAPGYVPIKSLVQPPGKKDQAPFEHKVSFANVRPKTLRVIGHKGPIAGATIDVDLIENIAEPVRTYLASYTTDAEGELSLLADPEAIHEVFVYAPDHAAGRALWKGAGLTVVTVDPLDSRLTLRGLQKGQMARVKPAGRSMAVHVVYAKSSDPVSVNVSRGTYDVTVLNGAREVVSGVTRSVHPGDVTEVDLTRDERARVTLRLPPQGDVEWLVNVTREEFRGPDAGGRISSIFADASSPLEPPAAIQQISPTEYSLTFAGSGSFTIWCDWWHSPLVLHHRVELKGDERREIVLPPLNSQLQGSFATYSGDGSIFHGVAGPRFVMLSARDAETLGWDVTVHLPRKRGNGDPSFELGPLPAGTYHVYQHLVTEAPSYSQPSRALRSPLWRTHAWGGIPVTLKEHATTTLRDFCEYPVGELDVSVRRASGKPLNDAVVQVRDPMYEGWLTTLHSGSTLAFAIDPILPPPAVRLENGKARLPAIRAGRLELWIELDDGRILACTRDVDPREALVIELPF
ncbi:MAG: hypothetical protein AB1486_34275 [Planctomycetota bacterium]